MLILGIDPGLIKTGWGIIESKDNQIIYIASGTIATNTKQPMGERLKNISKEISIILNHHKPTACAIEETFVNQNPLTSLKLGQARGAILTTIALQDIPIHEYLPNLIKKTVTGVGKAQKQQVCKMIKYLLPKSNTQTEDEADALAIAICHNSHLRKY